MLPKESQVSNLLGQKIGNNVPLLSNTIYIGLVFLYLDNEGRHSHNIVCINTFQIGFILLEILFIQFSLQCANLKSPLKSRNLFIFDGPRYQLILD